MYDCDIHIFVEFYNDPRKSWILMKHNDKYEPVETTAIIKRESDSPEQFADRIADYYEDSCAEYIPRNYALFSYLADVKNRHGINDLYVIEPISMRKGFPADISLEARLGSRYDRPKPKNYYGYTFYSAGEILSVKWDQVTVPLIGHMKSEKMEEYVDKRGIINKSIDPKDLVDVTKKEFIIYKFSEWRIFPKEFKDVFRNRGDVAVEFYYNHPILKNNQSALHLFDIAKLAYLQCPQSRLLLWFEDEK